MKDAREKNDRPKAGNSNLTEWGSIRIGKTVYAILDNFEILITVLLPNATYNSCYHLFIIQGKYILPE